MGDVIAGLALITTLVLWYLERRARRADAVKRESLEADVTALRRDHNDRLDDIAKAIATKGSIEDLHEQGAVLSVSLSPRNDRLVITNRGPGAALLQSITLLTSGTGGMVGPTGCEEDGVELAAGEEHRVLFALTAGMPSPIEVRTRWRDGRGQQERIHKVMH